MQRLCLVPRPTFRDALFFPHASALERLLALLRRAKFSIDVCVYCVTEERLVAALRDKAAARPQRGHNEATPATTFHHLIVVSSGGHGAG